MPVFWPQISPVRRGLFPVVRDFLCIILYYRNLGLYTGWRPALYLYSPSPALGLRVVVSLVIKVRSVILVVRTVLKMQKPWHDPICQVVGQENLGHSDLEDFKLHAAVCSVKRCDGTRLVGDWDRGGGQISNK